MTVSMIFVQRYNNTSSHWRHYSRQTLNNQTPALADKADLSKELRKQTTLFSIFFNQYQEAKAMTLIGKVKNICDRLATDSVWHDLFLRHGFDIKSLSLETELTKKLNVDRTLKGFEDFALDGERGIEAKNPSRSLLFHALASPNVTSGIDDRLFTLYPTAAEIETILEFVYGISPPTLHDIRQQAGPGELLAIVVFAVEYRSAIDTVHRTHAELCFSRTGVSRVGTQPALYEAEHRGFLPFFAEDKYAIRVLPARYSTYIAVQKTGNPQRFGPMNALPGDASLNFWVPIHKLFAGDECIKGLSLDVTLDSFHINEKLRRIHQVLGADSGWGEPDISAPPFSRSDNLCHWLPEEEYGSGLLSPIPHASLIEAAQYRNLPVWFHVPKDPRLSASSLKFSGGAPEYVHIRHRKGATGEIEDLNDDAGMMQEVSTGDYEALHYIDYTADGWVQAHCAALQMEIPERIAAYSILAAPDFFPRCTQRHLAEWVNAMNFNPPLFQFARFPYPLSDARNPANVQSHHSQFQATDKTVSAIIAHLEPSDVTLQKSAWSSVPYEWPPVPSARRTSWLPDAAAGEFAPGWDIATDTYDGVKHLAHFSLGSPFPEDAKLCSALSNFWPAVAPDAARVFQPLGSNRTVSPLLDEEINLENGNSWDGVAPPKKVQVGHESFTDFPAFVYGDYTRHALEDKFSLALTGKVDSVEYVQRLWAMRRVNEHLGFGFGEDGWMAWCPISVTLISKEAPELIEALGNIDKTNSANLYRFELYRYGTDPEIIEAAEFNRVRIKILGSKIYIVEPTAAWMWVKEGDLPWKRLQSNA
jgi:hypothetical protein